jgi:hypothetical protein
MPRCGALSLLHKSLTTGDIEETAAGLRRNLCDLAIARLVAASLHFGTAEFNQELSSGKNCR